MMTEQKVLEDKKYQVRIRKDLTKTKTELVGLHAVTEIQTLYGKFENISEVIERVTSLPEFSEYEVLSIILVDKDSSSQLGDLDWEDS